MDANGSDAIEFFDPALIRAGCEIETCLEGNRSCSDCDRCENCSINPCDYCDICEACEALVNRLISRDGRYTDIQTLCDHQPSCLLIFYDSERNRNIRIAPRRYRLFCEYCRDYHIDTDYFMPCDDCPLCEDCHSDTPNFEFTQYCIDPYEDGSCGMEYPTKPYDLVQIREILQKIYDELMDYDEGCTKASYKCGGHQNVSYGMRSLSDMEIDKVIHNARYFSDLLAYLFLTKDTYCRRSDHYRILNKDNKKHTDKYSFINVRNYDVTIFEFRYPDSLVYLNNYYLNLVVNSILIYGSLKNHKVIDYNDDDFRVIEWRYRAFCNSEFDLSCDDPDIKEKLKNKLYEFLVIFSSEIFEMSAYLSIDIKKTLLDLIDLRNKGERDADIFLYPLENNENNNENNIEDNEVN